jgi:arylsulfatase A-like enzyme
MPRSRKFRGLSLLLAIACVACGGAEGRRPPDGPNVLIVVMDTTRADRMSLHGYARPTTPHLDRFAEGGVVFTDAWSPAGWTGPAHASLFTGLRPEHHGYHRGNREWLPLDFVTLADLFGAEGYRTGCLNNNPILSSSTGIFQGFDRVTQLYRDRTRSYPWAPKTHRLALSWIDEVRAKGEPFFLFINDMEPHFEYRPPRSWEARFRRPGTDEEAVEEALRTHVSEIFAHNVGGPAIPPDRIGILSDLYDAEIAFLDAALGELLDGLRERGVLDETIVVITADHGENFGSHRFLGHMFSLHREICHVPLLVRFPGQFDGGRRIPDVVRLEDVAPTVLELAGLEVPAGLDGQSLLRDLAGRCSTGLLGPPNRFLDIVGSQVRPGDDLASLRVRVRSVYDGRHHYLRYSDGREELYDVKSDPGETRNLALSRSDHAEAIERLRRRITEP